MIYLDSSSLLKLFLEDRFTDAVDMAISNEKMVIVSLLTELETSVQIRAQRLGGAIKQSQYLLSVERLSRMITIRPFESKVIPARAFRTAFRQHQSSGVHCRSLDRLHLGAMEELGIERLMTHDLRQAAAAQELGYEVTSPGLG
jgi:predicted nucleic acid-binding protein